MNKNLNKKNKYSNVFKIIIFLMEKNNSNEVSTDSYKTTILTLETEEKEKEKEVTNETNNLSNIYIFILFMFLISSEFIMNISSGLISSCFQIMKQSLQVIQLMVILVEVIILENY